MNVRVMKDDSLITDTVMSGGISSATGFLSPGLYSYSFDRLAGDLVEKGVLMWRKFLERCFLRVKSPKLEGH